MKILQAGLVVLAFFFSGIAQAATTTVRATGSCPADPSNIQNAVNNAAPGDTIQLLPGFPNLPFNFSCGSVTIQTLALTIEGNPGATVINGPGSTTTQNAFVIFSDDVTITGISVQNFGFGIVATNPDFSDTETCPANLTITKNRFTNNGIGVLVLGVCDHFRFTNNVIHVPAPVSSLGLGNVGIAILTRDSDLLVADNTVVGPGPSGTLTSLDQLINGTGDSIDALIRTLGIQQLDVVPPASIRGRISGNTFTGLDIGLQASSNFGVVMQNTATHCEIGLEISNDTDDGVTRVTNEFVSLNNSTGNQIGFAVFSGTQNTIVLNNFANNGLAGLFFVANPGGAPSVGNFYGCNKGSVEDAGGNTVLPPCAEE